MHKSATQQLHAIQHEKASLSKEIGSMEDIKVLQKHVGAAMAAGKQRSPSFVCGVAGCEGTSTVSRAVWDGCCLSQHAGLMHLLTFEHQTTPQNNQPDGWHAGNSLEANQRHTLVVPPKWSEMGPCLSKAGVVMKRE